MHKLDSEVVEVAGSEDGLVDATAVVGIVKEVAECIVVVIVVVVSGVAGLLEAMF